MEMDMTSSPSINSGSWFPVAFTRRDAVFPGGSWLKSWSVGSTAYSLGKRWVPVNKLVKGYGLDLISCKGLWDDCVAHWHYANKDSLIHFSHPILRSFIHSFIHSFIRSFIHPSIHYPGGGLCFCIFKKTDISIWFSQLVLKNIQTISQYISILWYNIATVVSI